MPILIELCLIRLALGLDQRRVVLQEGGAYRMRPGGDGDSEIEVPIYVLVGVVAAQAVPVGYHVEQLEPVAVKRHLQNVRFPEAFHVLVPVARQSYLDLVLAIEREVVLQQGSAPGPEGKSVEMSFLGEIGAQYNDPASRNDAAAPHGQPADLLRRAEVSLHQRR